MISFLNELCGGEWGKKRATCSLGGGRALGEECKIERDGSKLTNERGTPSGSPRAGPVKRKSRDASHLVKENLVGLG